MSIDIEKLINAEGLFLVKLTRISIQDSTWLLRISGASRL